MKPNINYGDFEKLDLRVGKVIVASEPEWSSKLLRYEVDFGEEIGKRVMFSGIRKWYKPEDLIGKNFVFVLNMEPKKMGGAGEESQGMMIMVDGPEKPILIYLSEDSIPGTLIR